MEVQSISERRKVATARRHRPIGIHVREIPAGGDGSHGPEIGPYPQDLKLEVTQENGQIAVWFDDTWWLEALRRWKDVSLNLHILPSPDALLHPIVLHELDMVRRLQLSWRLIGHCYLSDIAQPTVLQRVAVNQYDEVRVIDRDRASTDAYDARPAKFTFAELNEKVRALQAMEKVSTPLLTRAPAPRR